jgi:hypothetical protein
VTVRDSRPFHRSLSMKEDESLDSEEIMVMIQDKGYDLDFAALVTNQVFDAIEDLLMKERDDARIAAARLEAALL